MWYESCVLEAGRRLRTEKAERQYLLDNVKAPALVFADIFQLGEESGAHYIQELASIDKQPLDWFTVGDMTEELKRRFPGAGVVCCEDLSKTASDPHVFEIAWGPLHRVAGLTLGLRTMVEHQYFKVRAIGDLTEDQEDLNDE